MKFSTKLKQQLKARAHSLKPIVFIGHQGLTANVKNEIDRGLYDHELIKIKIQETDRNIRREIFTEICESLSAIPIGLIGHIGIVYRESEKKRAMHD